MIEKLLSYFGYVKRAALKENTGIFAKYITKTTEPLIFKAEYEYSEYDSQFLNVTILENKLTTLLFEELKKSNVVNFQTDISPSGNIKVTAKLIVNK
jgi:hypothetical protein